MTGETCGRSGVIILGASSAIAEAVARRLAAAGVRLGLVARDPAKLEAIAADLTARGAPVVAADALDLAEAPCPEALDRLAKAMGGADTVLIAYGWLGDQAEAESSPEAASRLFQINFTSAALWALEASRLLQPACGREGLVVGLGSVAGDRGRRSNFVYGAAKNGLAVMLQGLAHRSAQTGAPRAMVVKLGFVDTPMTAAFKKGALWATPDQAAAAIVKAMRRPTAIVYAPSFWRWIMLIIRCLPEPLFNRVHL